MISPPWGLFALVSYVPDPLGAQLDTLTQSLPGVAFRQAHITILPPRPLRVPVEQASSYAQHILDEFKSFEIELSSVRRFPVTNVLYLDLAEGEETVHQLHDALNSGALAFEEQFDFHPHLTLAGPHTPDIVGSVQLRAERLWTALEPKGRFPVKEIVALWADSSRDIRSWKRLWVYTLSADQRRSAKVGTTGRTS